MKNITLTVFIIDMPFWHVFLFLFCILIITGDVYSGWHRFSSCHIAPRALWLRLRTVHYSDKRVYPCSAFVSLSQLSWAQSSAPAELIQADSEQQLLLWAAAATAAARPVWTRWWNQIPIKLWQNAVHPVQLIQANTQEINDTHTQGTQKKWMGKYFFFPRLRQRSTL